MLLDLTAATIHVGDEAANEDLPERLHVNLQQAPQRGIRRIVRTVPLAPLAVIPQESPESLAIDIAPVPLGLERRDGPWRWRQQRRRVAAVRTVRSKPVASDDAKIAAAGAGVRPPEIVMRIRRIPRRNDRAGVSAPIDRDDFDRVQVVGRQTQLAAEKTEGAADHVPAHANPWVLGERQNDAPLLEELPERFADGGARFDADGTPAGVVVDACHRRDVHDHPDIGVGDESLEAMPATRDDQPAPVCDRVRHGSDDLVGRLRQVHVVGARLKPLVEALLDDAAIAGIGRADSLRTIGNVAGCVV